MMINEPRSTHRLQIRHRFAELIPFPAFVSGMVEKGVTVSAKRFSGCAAQG